MPDQFWLTKNVDDHDRCPLSTAQFWVNEYLETIVPIQSYKKHVLSGVKSKTNIKSAMCVNVSFYETWNFNGQRY